MSMSELVNVLEDNGKGVRAYIECGRQARRNIVEHPEHATAYFLLAIVTDRFVEAYDDQPLLSQKAEDEFLRFKNYVDQFSSSGEDKSDAEMLKTLNEISKQIANHKLYRSDS